MASPSRKRPDESDLRRECALYRADALRIAGVTASVMAASALLVGPLGAVGAVAMTTPLVSGSLLSFREYWLARQRLARFLADD